MPRYRKELKAPRENGETLFRSIGFPRLGYSLLPRNERVGWRPECLDWFWSGIILFYGMEIDHHYCDTGKKAVKVV
jgi:hypothetical protein